VRETAMAQPASGSEQFDPGSITADSEQPWYREDAPLEPAEMLDSDDLGSTDAGRDPLDDSWDAPDRPSAGVRYPSTPREERAGPSFDRQLAAETPDADPYLEAERRESGAVLDADAYGEGTTTLAEDYDANFAIPSIVTPDVDARTAEEGALHLE
ncbi:hypothetical protein, partial [Frankia casuarinae]